ncbi:MAG: TatD family hydrolase [Brevinematia bacterium]
MFIDSHFHLSMIEKDFDKQKEVVVDSIEKGLSGGVNIYTSPKAFLENVEIARYLLEKGIKIACGWYPEYSPTEEMVEELENIIKENDIFAVGEIGLEYYRMHRPKKEQIELFDLQMELAKRYGKPVIIHSREAYSDTLEVLKNYPSVRGVMHCFSGTPEIAKKFLDINYYISFAGNLTFKNALDLHESIKYVPLDRILFETDAPFLAPVPFRGQKNYPFMVRYIYEFASNLLGIPLEELSHRVLQNWNEFIAG